MLTRHGFDRDATFVIELDAPFGPCRVSSELGNRRGFVVGYKHRATPDERFWRKVDKTGECWLWTASRLKGYGTFWVGPGKFVSAHRYSYEQQCGPIPEGLVLDHLCRVRHCVNPAHLEPVTELVNIQRGEAPTTLLARRNECKNGHPLTPENTGTRTRPEGGRRCLVCARAHNTKTAERRLKERQEARAWTCR